MKQIFSFFKNFVNSSKMDLQPNIAITPIENIEYPSTYKANFYANIPPRPPNALTGSQFGQSIINYPANQQRDDIILQQCAMGNVPSWMQNFKPISITDQTNVLTYFVSPDVLSIGSDNDFLRLSFNGFNARRVIDLFNCMLPTKRMSDQIWQNADLKLNPIPMGASPQMSNMPVCIEHNALIEQQRAGRNFTLIDGIKKDIIFYSPLLTYRSNVCIYGWHYPNGQAIQGAQYMAHNVFYSDYSQAIRLVSRTAYLNQQAVDLYQILSNPQYSHLINDEPRAYDASIIYK